MELEAMTMCPERLWQCVAEAVIMCSRGYSPVSVAMSVRSPSGQVRVRLSVCLVQADRQAGVMGPEDLAEHAVIPSRVLPYLPSWSQ